MGRILKKYIAIFLSLIFGFLVSINVQAGTYINIYYKDVNTLEISEGVFEIKSKLLTNLGIINVELIKIDLSNDDLKFQNVFNEESVGKKTSLKKLIETKENVVAAINGDFFEMSLTPSFELGMAINNGKIQKASGGEYYNYYSNSLATLLVDEDNNPFIGFIKPNITFSNGDEEVTVSYYNKEGDQEGIAVLTGEYFKDTKEMDKRHTASHKIIVSDNKIKKIIEPGESIEIDEDEYVVFIPETYECMKSFRKNDRVKLKIDLDSNIDIDEIKSAIGGAGIFLEDGKVVSNGYIVSGNNARSFVGYDREKENLFFGVVGGTTNINSGVTSNQLGEILLDYGIDTAMHLDGGGSSTLMTKSYYDEKVTQINDVRTQRAIINALVLTNESKIGKIAGFELKFDSNKTIVDVPISYEICAYDKNHKTVTKYNESDLNIDSDNNVTVDYKAKTITFHEIGRTNLEVSLGKYESSLYVDVYDDLVEIQILPDPIILEEDEEVDLNIIALTSERYKIPINHSSCEFVISPQDIAEVKDGKLVGLKEGAGTIGVMYDGLEAYSIISIGSKNEVIDNFKSCDMEELSYPDTANCNVSNSNGKLKINYEFEKSSVTQAAYAKYEDKLMLPKGASKLTLDVTGDNKKAMLKIKFVDSNNNEYTQTACDIINFKNKRKLEVNLPTSYSGNLYIERYYLALLKTDKRINSSVLLDNVTVIIPTNYSNITRPKSIVRKVVSNNENITGLINNDIVFLNNSAKNTMLSNYLDNEVSKIFNNVDGEKVIVARNTNRIAGIVAGDGLKVNELKNTLVVSMSTIKGSIFDKDPYQFEQLENILNKSDKENVIITLDGDLTKNNLIKDKTMLEYILNKYYNKRRVNFYVVMFDVNSPLDKMDSGIRYIRISNLLSNAYTKNVLIMRENEEEMLDYNLINYEELIKNVTYNDSTENDEEITQDDESKMQLENVEDEEEDKIKDASELKS